MELSGRGLLLLIILIVVVIVVAILIFNRQFPTQAERDANNHKLVWGIVLGIAGAVVLVCLLMSGGDEKEYGVWTSIKKWARNTKEDVSESYHNKKAQWKAGKASFKGESIEERDLRVSELKKEQQAATQARLAERRGIKNAGKQAEAEAARNAREARSTSPKSSKSPSGH